MPDDANYHLRRARAERDLAYRSVHEATADSHYRLSVLHFQRALRIEEESLRLNPATATPPHLVIQHALDARRATPTPANEPGPLLSTA